MKTQKVCTHRTDDIASANGNSWSAKEKLGWLYHKITPKSHRAHNKAHDLWGFCLEQIEIICQQNAQFSQKFKMYIWRLVKQ